jgi:hypothetical protein
VGDQITSHDVRFPYLFLYEGSAMKVASIYFAVLVTTSMVIGQSVHAAERKVPAKVLSQFEYFIGDWIAEGTTSEGEASKATLSVKWAPGNHMLVWNATWKDPNIESKGSGIFGWDAIEERVHMSEFWDNNVYHHRHFKIESDKVWDGEEFCGVTSEGKSLRQKFKIEVVGPNKCVMVAWDRVVDGQKEEGSAELTLVRK